MSFQKGSKVWLQDKEYAWVEAEVIDARDKLLVVTTAWRTKVLDSVKESPFLGPKIVLCLGIPFFPSFSRFFFLLDYLMTAISAVF